MNDVFSSLYAQMYDALYREKDYTRESDLVIELLLEHGQEIRSILDLGCGTASHAVRFAELGYQVVGVDRSPAMLQLAAAKTAGRANVELLQSDIRELDLDRSFDAVVMLFAVLGYHTGDEDVLAALAAARRHLRPGGLLVFDVWFGPAVLHDRPETRFTTIPLDRGELLRAVTPGLDVREQLCRVHYELWRIEDGRVADAVQEDHVMRFFFPNELRLLLAQAGFTLVRLSAFPDVDRAPDETTWNAVTVARLT